MISMPAIRQGHCQVCKSQISQQPLGSHPAYAIGPMVTGKYIARPGK